MMRVLCFTNGGRPSVPVSYIRSVENYDREVLYVENGMKWFMINERQMLTMGYKIRGYGYTLYYYMVQYLRLVQRRRQGTVGQLDLPAVFIQGPSQCRPYMYIKIRIFVWICGRGFPWGGRQPARGAGEGGGEDAIAGSGVPGSVHNICKLHCKCRD